MDQRTKTILYGFVSKNLLLIDLKHLVGFAPPLKSPLNRLMTPLQRRRKGRHLFGIGKPEEFRDIFHPHRGERIGRRNGVQRRQVVDRNEIHAGVRRNRANGLRSCGIGIVDGKCIMGMMGITREITNDRETHGLCDIREPKKGLHRIFLVQPHDPHEHQVPRRR